MLSLLQLKKHVQTQKHVSIVGLSQIFHEDPSIIEGMLSHLIQKGSVRRCEMSNLKTCSRCPIQCSKQPLAMFEWID